MSDAGRDEVVASRRGDEPGLASLLRRARRAGAPATLTVAAVAALAVLVLVTHDSGKPDPQAAGHGPVQPSPHAAASPTSGPRPVRVPPLCKMPNVSLPNEPDGEQLPGCPITTPAGYYASTTFIGNNSYIPYTFNLPDGWRIVPRGYGFVVDLRTRGRTAISIVSDPRYVGARVPTAPRELLRQLANAPHLTVSTRHRAFSAEEPMWLVADLTAPPDTPAQDRCRPRQTCLPVLTTGYPTLDGTPSAVVGVAPGAIARLLLNGVTAANIAVWLWNIKGPAADEARAVADSIRLLPVTYVRP